MVLWKDTAHSNLISFSYYCWIRETNPNSFHRSSMSNVRADVHPISGTFTAAVPAQLRNHTKPSPTRTAFRHVVKYSLLLHYSSCGHRRSASSIPHSWTVICYRRRMHTYHHELWTYNGLQRKERLVFLQPPYMKPYQERTTKWVL